MFGFLEVEIIEEKTNFFSTYILSYALWTRAKLSLMRERLGLATIHNFSEVSGKPEDLEEGVESAKRASSMHC